MREFRFQGTYLSGKYVQGVIAANNLRDAKRRSEKIAQREQIRLTNLQPKTTFVYKIQRGSEKYVVGEQQAYSAEEVENALRKLNYNVLWVRKKLLNLRLAPPSRDIVLFCRICADLLREGLGYNDALNLLVQDVENKTLSQAIRDIQQDLKEGKDGVYAFGKQTRIFGRFTSYMLGVASTSGNMAGVYDSTAKFLERDEDFKKSIRSALIMPITIMFFLLIAIGFYVGYIFPATAEMFLKFDVKLPPMTKATLQLSNFIRDNMYWLPFPIIGSVVGAIAYLRTDRGQFYLGKFIIKVPVIGELYHKTSIEIFARVFNTLYSGAGDNIAVLRIAAEACRNRYMEHQVKEVAIPMMLKDGHGLVASLERTGIFTATAMSRLRSGQEAGTLKDAAGKLANYYERETGYKMKNVVEFINLAMAMVIMLVTLMLTLVSGETAVMQPESQLKRR